MDHQQPLPRLRQHQVLQCEKLHNQGSEENLFGDQKITSKKLSKFTQQKGKRVTEAQYITELICEKKATQEGVELPDGFWKIPKWKKYFQFQIVIANRLIKKYRGDAIISALRDKRASKTYSLRSPFLVRIIEEFNKKPPLSISFSGSKIQRSYDSGGDFSTPSIKKNILENLDD